MTYSVYQHWDPLKVCIVGRSYSPEFYKFVENARVRTVLEKIAHETEEDYQKLIKLLGSFGVEILRPEVSSDYEFYLKDGKIAPPPMTPRDYSIMLGKDFYFQSTSAIDKVEEITELEKLDLGWNNWKGDSWPSLPPASLREFDQLPRFVKDELQNWFDIDREKIKSQGERRLIKDFGDQIDKYTWGGVLDHVLTHNKVFLNRINNRDLSAAGMTRIGKDCYVGTRFYGENNKNFINTLTTIHPDYRFHPVDTGGHSDATFCPVKPGLIVSLYDIPTYKDTFPNWEVVYLPGQSWNLVKPFLDLKSKNKGKWWVPGEELNDEFTSFVESWLDHWTGYVEETVFDVNMLVIDEKNVVCNNYNKQVFKAFERHGITPHIINFRHRYFWDGGLHCVTSDVHREGAMKDYFPDRG